MTTIKEHWLHGKIEFNVDIKEEDKCVECEHWAICKKSKQDMHDFCLNYCFGTSDSRESCNGCIHRYTRGFDGEEFKHGKFDKIPCFKCMFFRKKGELVELYKLLELLEELRKIGEEYYSYDEEDEYIEKLCWKDGKYIGLKHIPELAILGGWSNDRTVVPIEIIEDKIKKLVGKKDGPKT